MFKNWVALYYMGGNLRSTNRMRKKDALVFMANHVDCYNIIKSHGVFARNKVICKNNGGLNG